jgi:hypothetical protein
MQRALYGTAVMNALGAYAIAPFNDVSVEWLGLPTESHLYRWVLAELILAFGVGYAWCGVKGEAPRVFISVAAAGKLGFFWTLVALAAAGHLRPSATAVGSGDLFFGCLFLIWLYQSRHR